MQYIVSHRQDFIAGLTGGGLTIDIHLTGQNENVVAMDHHPSWRLHKNPFWRVKHPSLKKAVAPDDTRSITSGTMYTAAAAASTATHYNVDATKEHQMYVYEASEPVQGVCVLSLPSGKKVDHLGIKIQFIGRIDMVRGSSNLHQWTTLVYFLKLTYVL
jgi:Vacuolar protein sorting-associated protein 26